MTDPNPKPQIHPSDVHGILACGHRWEKKKLLGEIEPITTPLVVGTATHAVAAKNLKNKVEFGQLFHEEQVRDEAHDALLVAWNEAPVMLDDSEQGQGLTAVRGAMTDLAVNASLVHHHNLAPTLQIAETDDIEWKWVLKTGEQFNYDLAGTSDVIETYPVPQTEELSVLMARVRDLKVVKQKPNQHEIEQSGQWTAYAMAVQVIKKLEVDEVRMDAIIKPTKTRGLRLLSFRSARTTADISSFLERLKRVQAIIQAGLFAPANPAEPWAPCGNCGFAQNCRFYTKRPTSVGHTVEVLYDADAAKSKTKPKPKAIVTADSEAWLDATRA